MTTDFRALCAELADDLQEARDAVQEWANKDKNVSKLVNHGYAWRRIEDEISKCIPLCANCHRLEHWDN